MTLSDFIIKEASLLESEYGWKGCGVNECWYLYGMIRALRPGNVVEIGVFNGCSSVWIAKALQDNGQGQLWSIDKNDTPLALKRAEVLEVSNIIHFIKSDSSEFAKTWPHGRCVDVLWIDGNHTILGVSADYINWVPFVRENGMVMAHDAISSHPLHQVSEFFKCVSRMQPVIWIHTGGMGIAQCQLDKEHPIS